MWKQGFVGNTLIGTAIGALIFKVDFMQLLSEI